MSRGDSSQQLTDTLCTISTWPVTSSSAWVAHGFLSCGSAGSAAGTTWVKLRKGVQKHPNRHCWLLPGGSAVLCDELLMQFPATEGTSHPKSWRDSKLHTNISGRGDLALLLHAFGHSNPPHFQEGQGKGQPAALDLCSTHNIPWESGEGLVTMTKQAKDKQISLGFSCLLTHPLINQTNNSPWVSLCTSRAYFQPSLASVNITPMAVVPVAVVTSIACQWHIAKYLMGKDTESLQGSGGVRD